MIDMSIALEKNVLSTLASLTKQDTNFELFIMLYINSHNLPNKTKQLLFYLRYRPSKNKSFSSITVIPR